MQIDLFFLLPEITIIVIIAILALIEIFMPAFSHRHSTRLNLAGILWVTATTILIAQRQAPAYQEMFTADAFANFFKFIFLGTAACVILMRQESRFLGQGGEFPLILWSALLGMFFLVSAKDFLLFFISLELLTLSIYALAAYTRSELVSIEAGLKYLILGSLASAFLLYGISLIYAVTGTLAFEEIAAILAQGKISWVFSAGVLMILSALGFKVAAVPFQVWVPDVYQGAPTPVVAFLSVASKAAGFAGLLRIFFYAFLPLGSEREILFTVLASLTLLYGNLGALVQKDMKRLLGYSSIGHAGFLLIAMASHPDLGSVPLLYYVIAYAFSNLTAFLVVVILEKTQASHHLESYQGLSRRSPFLAAAMFLALLSLAGVPPLAGFFSKFFILLSAARSGLTGIVFLAAVNVAISLYYYLNVVKIMYFDQPVITTAIAPGRSSKLVLIGLMIGIVLVGVWQAPFFRFASSAAQSLF